MLSCELKKLNQDWRDLLAPCLGENFDDDIVKRIDKFLSSEHPNFYPPKENMLKPFRNVSVEDIRVVIVGNCPYPCDKQATGLPFSSPPDSEKGKSVKCIFKAMIVDIYGINHNDEKMLDEKMPNSGCLEYLPPQGVFLINRKFTVASDGKEHEDNVWEEFSKAVICLLSKKLDSSVFMLWGGPAKKLRDCIDKNKHLRLEAYHPAAPLHRSYKDVDQDRINYVDQDLICRKHFSQANDYLEKKGRGKPINWLNNQSP